MLHIQVTVQQLMRSQIKFLPSKPVNSSLGFWGVTLSPLFPFRREGNWGCAQRAVMSCFCSSPGFRGETCMCVYVEGREKDAEHRATPLPCVCLSAGDLLPCCVLTWWQLARWPMWAASLKAVSASLLRGESFPCFSARCFACVCYPQQKENQRKETFSLLCSVPLPSHLKRLPCRSRVVSLPCQDCDVVRFSIQSDW